MVLLKNDGILPLKLDGVRTIAVIGPNADSRDALKGNYCGTPSETYTVLEGLRQALPGVRLILAEGCSLVGGSDEAFWGETSTYRIAEALKAAQVADLCIVVTGLNGDKEGEEGYGSGDRTTMLLPESQRDLLDALSTVNKPMVLVNMTGSATVFPHEEKYGAILQAWYPGQMGGIAVANLLLGKASPCGKLPVTFYRDMDQVPDFKDYSMHGRTYRYLADKPAYPFGYGLSYAKFAYSDIAVTPDGDGLKVEVTVKNCGDIAAKEITEVYVRLDEPEFESPLRQLAAFTITSLAAGEEKRLALHVRAEHLCVCNDDGVLVRHNGPVTVYAGGSQPDARSEELTGEKPLSAKV